MAYVQKAYGRLREGEFLFGEDVKEFTLKLEKASESIFREVDRAEDLDFESAEAKKERQEALEGRRALRDLLNSSYGVFGIYLKLAHVT